MGRFLDIASRIQGYEINELNEISPSARSGEAVGQGSSNGTTNQGASAEDTRRKAVLDMLAQAPSVNHAFVCDAKAEADHVIVTVGIRGVGTCDLRIPREKYDGLAVLKLIEEHTGAAAQVRQVH
jgi:hypothetical protein